MSKRILIGGGSGFIGSSLASSLRSKGHNVTIISRGSGKDRITWQQIQKEGLPPCDAIIQIPGANIMDKTWTKERKQELLDSRVGTTKTLVTAIHKMEKGRPKVFVSGSAVGIYPIKSSKTFDEDYQGPPADNFAGELCSEWENAVNDLDKDIRRAIVRTGIVLGKNGGALAQMLLPFKLGLGGVMASGQQYWPWIHLDDIVGIMEHAVENEKVKGVLNGVSPEISTNYEFTKALGKVLNRPTLIPMPEFALNLMFGERAFLLSEGQKVIPKRVLESGYEYKFPTLEAALKDIVS